MPRTPRTGSHLAPGARRALPRPTAYWQLPILAAAIAAAVLTVAGHGWAGALAVGVALAGVGALKLLDKPTSLPLLLAGIAVAFCGIVTFPTSGSPTTPQAPAPTVTVTATPQPGPTTTVTVTAAPRPTATASKGSTSRPTATRTTSR